MESYFTGKAKQSAWRVSSAKGPGVYEPCSFPSVFSAACRKKCKQQKKTYIIHYDFIRQFSAIKKKKESTGSPSLAVAIGCLCLLFVLLLFEDTALRFHKVALGL